MLKDTKFSLSGLHTNFRCKFVLLFSVVAISFLTACAADKTSDYTETPVDILYNEAQDAMDSSKYATAVKKFDEVERQHPYSKWATKAQMMSAYASYLANNYDDAVIALDRFIQLHPSNKDVPYAYYLKGLCYYEQISTVNRDQRMTRESLKVFNEILTRFPDSKFARDARIKIELTFDHLAGKEMEIGRYYQNQGQHIAAINRFKVIIDKYQVTTHVAEALHRTTESYMALGLVDKARETAAVLGHNFPGSDWYADAYKLVEGRTISLTSDEEIEDADTPWYQVW